MARHLVPPLSVPDRDAHHRALTVCNELVAKLKPPNAVATRTDAAKALQDFLAFASKQALLTAKEAAREAGAIPPLILAASAVQHASDENQVDLGESALCALATVARDENGKNRLAIREAGGVALALKVVEGALARGAASIDTAEEALELLVALTDENCLASRNALMKAVIHENGLEVTCAVLAQPLYSAYASSRCPSLALELLVNLAAAGGLESSEACARALAARAEIAVGLFNGWTERVEGRVVFTYRGVLALRLLGMLTQSSASAISRRLVTEAGALKPLLDALALAPTDGFEVMARDRLRHFMCDCLPHLRASLIAILIRCSSSPTPSEGSPSTTVSAHKAATSFQRTFARMCLALTKHGFTSSFASSTPYSPPSAWSCTTRSRWWSSRRSIRASAGLLGAG